MPSTSEYQRTASSTSGTQTAVCAKPLNIPASFLRNRTYFCPICPRSFGEDPALRVHLTETHHLYDLVPGGEGRSPAPRLQEPRSVPGGGRPLPRLGIQPEADIWAELGIERQSSAPEPRRGSRVGPLIAVGAGVCLITAAFLPY